MKNLILACFLFACAGAAEDRPEPVADAECHPLDGDFSILCVDPVDQGLFSSASCYTAEEVEDVLQSRAEALADGSCVVPEYFRHAEPRPQPEPVIIEEY